MIVEIIYDLLFIGKSASKEHQFSKDTRRAKRLRKAIQANDEETLKRQMKKEVLLTEKDIIGIGTSPAGKCVIISEDMFVKYWKLWMDLRRCKRARKR